jgi:aspartyl-tRNA(Asn)/glutamyl-tRNA(Gln) amidotransferase subunit A
MLGHSGAQLREVDCRGTKDAALLVGVITVGEALSYHGKWLQARAKDYGADVRERMEANWDQRTVEYLQAQEKRRTYTEALVKIFDSVDVLAAPTLPVLPPLIGQKEISWGRTREDVRAALLRMTRPGNLTGLPAVSLPCGYTADSLPVGLQLIGRHYDEATLLRVAYAYEQATPWHKMFPPI